MDFICENSDIIGCSFVKTPEDILMCLDEITSRLPEEKRGKMPLMSKIETAKGIKNLPEIIVAASGKNPFSVMIARGDLAVESGYMRLAELQQEILWICEASNTPVVWATQVLDNMARSGIPTRAEVTDAAEGGARAECVMLNKGENIVETVKFLDKLLEKMERNQYKKAARLRALNLARGVSLDD